MPATFSMALGSETIAKPPPRLGQTDGNVGKIVGAMCAAVKSTRRVLAWQARAASPGKIDEFRVLTM
jgi:hypothetical protein